MLKRVEGETRELSCVYGPHANVSVMIITDLFAKKGELRYRKKYCVFVCAHADVSIQKKTDFAVSAIFNVTNNIIGPNCPVCPSFLPVYCHCIFLGFFPRCVCAFLYAFAFVSVPMLIFC